MASGKKQQIIQTAQAMFFKMGIADTGMDSIAEAASVSKMTIYKYFGSKEGLLESVVDEILAKTHGDFQTMIQESGNTLELLNRLIEYRELDDVTPVFVHDLMSGYPKIVERLFDFNEKEIMPAFEEAIFRGQQSGEIRKDISPHLLVLYLTSMKEFMSKPGRLDGLNMRSVNEQLMSLLIHGMMNK